MLEVTSSITHYSLLFDICDVMKQNESEAGNNILLVSEVLFHLNIRQMSMLRPCTCRLYEIDDTQSYV